MISVEVKVNGTEEEARVQIGIWLSAWHERVGQLGEDEGHRVITLPVIIVLNHYWHLYFAVDKGSHIVRAFRSPACHSSILTPPGNSAVHGKHGRYFVACEGLPDTGCAPALGRVGIGDVRALV
jgi:hypothetical protein